MSKIYTLLLISLMAFGQAGKIPPVFGSAAVRVADSNRDWVTVGILPNGRVRAHRATLRTLIAAAYDVDLPRVTGGPQWLDSDRFDIEAQASPGLSKADRLVMMQSLLAQRFKLVIRHEPRTTPFFALVAGPGGPKLQASAANASSECAPAEGATGLLHFVCHASTTAELAELLPGIARNYASLPVTDLTGLSGAYDFQLDWMGKGVYDAAIKAKSPAAVSMFDALAKLGLVLEKRDDVKDAIVVTNADRLTAPGASAASRSLTSGQLANIDRYVKEEMAREHVPGIEVGVYSRGQILLAKGFGLANVELDVPVKPETVFQSGSVGKQFVSAAIMMLVEEGKIGLDDSIIKYFPNAPDTWKPILVKNLLSHTSGLAEYESSERIGPKGPFYLRLDFTEDQLVEKIEALPIEAKVGEVWNYRNTNYVLLGIMIHKVTGRHFSHFLDERIFKPWYMTSTRLISESEIIPNRAAGYELGAGDKLRNQEWVSPSFNSTGDGTLYFNVLDLAKWDEALYGTSLLKQSSLDRMWTVFTMNDGKPNSAHYGFGWGIGMVNGHKVISHGGAWQGFTCQISRFVDDSLTVVVLTNSAAARPGVITNGIAALINPALKPPPPKERKEIQVDAKVLEGYVGKYQLAPNALLTITRNGDSLVVQLTGQEPVQLFAESERNFFLKVVDAQVTFVTDSRGRATELVLHQGGDRTAKRAE